MNNLIICALLKQKQCFSDIFVLFGEVVCFQKHARL